MKTIFLPIIGLILLLFTASSVAKPKLIFEVYGIEGDVKKNVTATLVAHSILVNSSHDIQEFYQRAPEEINKALQPFGYFRATIHSSITLQPNGALMRFNIAPGPPLLVTKFDFQVTGAGEKEACFQKIVANPPLTTGQIFSVEKYNLTKKLLRDAALQYGYFSGNFQQASIHIDLVHYNAAITLHYATGNRYRFGTILFNKNPYDDAFLRRFADFHSFQYYHVAKVQRFQENLTTADYFQQVSVDPQFDEGYDKIVPLRVHLTPLPRREYDLGLGFGTDTGPRVTLNYVARQLTTDGQLFKAQLQASQVYSNLQANYIIPGKNPATDKYVWNAAVQQLDIAPGVSHVEKITGSYVTSLYGIQQVFTLALQHENWTLTDQPSQSAIMLIPSITWSKIYKNNQVTPSKGFRADFNILGTPAGSNSFLQSQLNLKGIYPVLDVDRILGRLDLGYTIVKKINQMPLSYAFLAGGTQSVRGYSFNAIGPGSTLLVSSVEFRQKIKDAWYLAAFIDAGNASGSFPGKLKKGIGFGPVWESPVGTIELTIAQAMDSLGKPLMIQFSMGPDL